MDLDSVIKFLLIYLLFCFIQYFVSLLGTIFDLISAYLACKLVDFQEKLDAESEKESETNCIGFQAPTITDDEEEDNED